MNMLAANFAIVTIIEKNNDSPIDDEEEEEENDKFINTTRVKRAVMQSV